MLCMPRAGYAILVEGDWNTFSLLCFQSLCVGIPQLKLYVIMITFMNKREISVKVTDFFQFK